MRGLPILIEPSLSAFKVNASKGDNMLRTGIFLAAALASGAGDTRAQEPTKYSPDNPFAKGLEERIKEEKAIRARSRAIGRSSSITCGKKIVTIPVIIDGEHMMSMTLWKSSIMGLTYLNPEAMQKRQAAGRELVDYVLVHLKEELRSVGQHEKPMITTSKRNYGALLDCLDQD